MCMLCVNACVHVHVLCESVYAYKCVCMLCVSACVHVHAMCVSAYVHVYALYVHVV